MATPPFNPNEAIPADSDFISAYPAEERSFRDIIESWILIEHNRNGTHIKVTLDDLAGATPAGTADLLTVWHEAGELFMRFGTGGIEQIVTTAAGTALIDPAFIPFADQAEAEAGTAEDVVMSPLRAQEHYDAQPIRVIQRTDTIFDNPAGNPQTWTKPANLLYAVVHVYGPGGGAQGTDGGTSSFGSHCSATGGQGGNVGLTAGGSGANGDINLDGQGGLQFDDRTDSGDTAGTSGGKCAGPLGGTGGDRLSADGDFPGGGGGFHDRAGTGFDAGAGGGYSRKVLLEAALGATESVNVGAGGVEGSADDGNGADGLVVVEEYTIVEV